jgi:hypothetical protein
MKYFVFLIILSFILFPAYFGGKAAIIHKEFLRGYYTEFQ